MVVITDILSILHVMSLIISGGRCWLYLWDFWCWADYSWRILENTDNIDSLSVTLHLHPDGGTTPPPPHMWILSSHLLRTRNIVSSHRQQPIVPTISQPPIQSLYWNWWYLSDFHKLCCCQSQNTVLYEILKYEPILSTNWKSSRLESLAGSILKVY